MSRYLRTSAAVCAALATALLGTLALVSAQTAVTLSVAPTPGAAQAGIQVVNLTGSGFPAGTIAPANVTVTLAPRSGGTSATTTATGVTTVAGTTRRVSFVVPAAIVVTQPTTYSVRISGSTANGVAFASSNAATLTVNPPPKIVSLTPATVAAGSSAAITITTQYTNFVQGATVASFDAGVGVGGAAAAAFGPVTVTSPTTVVAQIAVAQTAAGGPRTVRVKTGVQEASLTSGFTVQASETGPPTITASLSPQPNQAGWHNGAVTVTFACGPSTASIAFCSPPVTVEQEGAGQAITGTVRDASGREAATTVTVNIDRTAPSIAAVPSASDWTNANVSVSFTCTDDLSGIAQCQPPASVTAEGEQSVSGTAADRAGNTATAQTVVRIDRTPPTITATPDRAANSASWYNAPVTLTYACADALSGVTACPPPVSVDQDGAAQNVARSVSDRAGNSATASATVNLDRVPPAVTITAPADGAVVSASPVAVSSSVVDALSGIASATCADAPATVSGTSVACQATVERTRAIAVTVIDRAGNTASSTVSVTRAGSNNGVPIARPGGPYSGQAQSALTFNGSTSSDPDGDALTYTWDFGDSGTATGASPSHTYSAAGTYTIALTVRDALGATHTATTSANIVRSNHTPNAIAGGPYTADVNSPVAFDASASTDPDGDLLTYAWEFGDGGTGAGQRPRRAYLTPGTFTAKVTVNDGFGGTHSASATVTIRAANRTPRADAGGPYEASTGEEVMFSGAASKDPDNDQLAYEWSFGDGGTATGRDVSHAYTTAGSFNVTLTVRDGRGGSHSATVQAAIAAANGAPTAHAGGPYSGIVGRAITFDGGQSSDPDSDALTYSWSFGDGGSRSGQQPQYTYDSTGTFTVTLAVSDGRGGTNTATASATIRALEPSDNHAPVASAGGPYAGEAGVPVSFSGAASADADGDALQYAWTFGDGSTATGVSPKHAFTTAGTYQVTVSVSDGHGGSHANTATAVIASQADRMAPSIELSGPTEVLPGTEVTVTATAVDNVAVASVTFVHGGSSSTVTTPPYQRTLTIPAVAAPGTTIDVQATAADPSGNTRSSSLRLTVIAQPDTTAPTVTLSIPEETGPGATLHVGATASDPSGIESVVFHIGATQVLDGSAPYSATYQVPANTPAGTSIAVLVDAIDLAGNHGSAQGSVAVAAAPDTTAPVVHVVAPPTTRAGATLALGANATDAGGVASITLLVNGVPLATLTSEPYETTFDVPENVVAGMRLQVEARAIDFAGLQSVATASIEVLDSTTSDVVVTGEVYDDRSGLVIPGASVTLVSPNGASLASTTTDERGRYSLGAPSGNQVVRITKSGWTTVERLVAAATGAALELFDARLTPMAPSTRTISPVLGGTLEHEGVTATVPAGAVAAETALTLTRVGVQGLRGLLPAGWSPVAPFDLAPATVTFQVPVAVSAPRNGLAQGTPLVFAMWDPMQRGWRAIANTVAGPADQSLAASIDRAGHYAWLKADTLPTAPPTPTSGQVVAGVSLAGLPANVQTVVNPQPKVIVSQPDVRSDVTGTITAAAPISSGTHVWARVVESYHFNSGSEAHPEPFVQDFVFYQSAADSNVLLGMFPVTPTLAFEPASLQEGVLTVELSIPPADAANANVIDATGGEVVAATGQRLSVAAGLTTTPLAAKLTPLTAADLGPVLPPGVELVDAALVSLSGGTLSGAAVLSVAKPSGLPASAQLLLARLDTIQGTTRLVLVGLGAVSGDRIVSVAALPTNQIAFEGVRTGGRYAFVRPTSAVGFVAGRVLATQGTSFAGALVSTQGLAIVSLSRSGGVYVAAAPLGTARLSALDLQKSDTASGQVAIAAAGAEAALDLRLTAQPPRVVSISPGEGARNVALTDPITVLFSEPIDPASLVAHVRLVNPDGAAAEISTAVAANNTTLTIRPTQPLSGDTAYTLTVEKIKDASGYELAAASIVHFTTVDVTAPLPPVAGRISASIPDNGTTTITATAGTAAPRDTVTVLNVTRGTSTPVLLDPNLGFLVLVQASMSDVLKLRITDGSGNETLIDIPRFSRTNADGSRTAVVNAAGGRVDGPDGVGLDITPGTFPEGTLVTIKAIAEAVFPIQLTIPQKQVFAYSGGVQIDFGGAEPQHYVDVSVQAKPGDKASDQWIVAQAVTLGGVPTFNAVDMASLAAGRITTASPPCPGVTAQGVYGIYKSNRAVGLNYGEVYNNTVDGGLRLTVEGLNVDVGGFTFPFPVVAMRQQMPVCMPTLTGNVSIEENVRSIKIDPDVITPADRAIQVRNTSVTPAAKYSFPRNILEFAFQVPGHEDDPFVAIVEKIDGTRVTLTSQQIASIATDPGASTVTIRLNMDKLNVTPKTFIFRNERTTPAVETSFAADVNAIALNVAAGANDVLEVSAIDAEGVGRVVPFTVVGSKYSSGNLAVRAVRGAIDPSPQEIAEYNGWPVCSATQPYPCRGELLDPNHGVIRVVFRDETIANAPPTEIPMSSIVRGAMAFPFQGDRTHRYRLQVFYQDGDVESISIPGYSLLVTSTQTGQVIRRIVAQAPARGEPQNLGTITNDKVRPVLTQGPQRYDNFDPSKPLTFTFSEAIDATSARNLILRDSAGRAIAIASVVVSPDGRTVTFIPVGSLRLGEQYTVDFSELTDAAGNRVLAAALRLKTFAPRRLCLNDGGCQVSDSGTVEATLLRGSGPNARQLEPIEDIGFTRNRDAQNRLRTNLFLTLGGYEVTDYRMSAIDVTDPRNAFEVGRDFGGRGKRRQFIVEGLSNFRVAPEHVPGSPSSPHSFPQNDPCPVPNLLFTGNIAAMSSFTPDSSYLTFYNVTNPASPCVLGDKTLTVSPFALSDSNRKNTVHASGFARGVAAISHSGGVSVFTAVGEVGVTATDLARNIPARFPDARLVDPLYPGDVIDLRAFHDRLLIARRDEPRFEVLDVNLAPVASVDLPERPVRIVVAEGLPLDLNGDEQITQSELRDLAFVATDTCSWGASTGAGQAGGACAAHLQVIDITTVTSPALIGSYRLPGAVSSMDVDAARRRLIVGGSVWQQYGGGDALYLIDVSAPNETNGPDADNDGWDDRIVWRQRYASARANAVRLDADRGLAYVGLSYYSSTGRERGAVDVWSLFDDCCDLGVDFTAEPDTHPTGPDLLDREVRAIRAGIKKGLDSAQFGEPAAPGRAPVHACNAVTSTNLTMLEQGSGACIWRGPGGCDGTYQPGLSDHDFEVFFPQMTPDTPGAPEQVRCVIDRLNAVFADHKAVSFTNKLGRADSMSFDDVTFYPVALGELTRARLGIHPPTAAGGSDPGGDLGMGRQQLLLKWLLEGEYVHGIDGYQLNGPNLEWTLQLVRTSHTANGATGVPLIEGYEWARLMEYNLAKAKTYIRIKGSSQSTSAFREMYVKQLHDAGKFGLRAALARLVAVPAENHRAIADASRAAYHSGLGCLDMQPNATSSAWQSKSCASFEEYVASAAARSPIFTEAERQLVARFYRVKSDRESIPTELAADQFIAATHAFIQQVKLETYAVYAQLAPAGADAEQRGRNMTALVGPDHSPDGFGGKLHKEMTQAALKLAPRFYNEGFRNADNVLAAMYRGVSTPTAGVEVKTLRINLAGGESRYVRSIGSTGTPFSSVNFEDRNLNDISFFDRDSKAYAFVLGAGDANNPSINQNANFGEPQNVVFTIDLPTRSGDPGHLVQEANRENNYDGFTYYIVARQNPQVPAGQGVPLPVGPGSIDPDPSCFVSPQMRVMTQNIDYVNGRIKLTLLNTSNQQLTNVQICSDLAGRCIVVGTLGPNQLQEIELAFELLGESGTFGSNITVYGRTVDGQDVAIRWNNTLVASGSAFDVKAYDNTPLNAPNHPFSRWDRNRVRQQPAPTPPAGPTALAVGDDAPVRGVTTDGTDRALRIRIRNLRPNTNTIIRLLDADTRKVEDGIGTLHLGTTSGVELSLTADQSGIAELFYTPPAYFVRPGAAYQNGDFNRIERAVRVSVVQDAVGVSNLDIALRRPPVFLVHGLFGTIHVWRDFQPLVPYTPPVGVLEEAQSAIGLSQSNAQYYQAREGYDGRFDLFVVGAPHASASFAVGARDLRADIALSLQGFLEGYAIGKVDLIAHSMGGVLARKLTNEDPQVAKAVRKLILINSPQGGSQIADKMVEARAKAPLKIEDPKPFDVLDIDPSNVNSINPAKVKIEWCSAVLNVFGRSGALNIYNGGTDDLRTALHKQDGSLTEIGRIVTGDWEVPTHHIVDTTTQNDLGFSLEVTALWNGLGFLCNLTPEASTLEKTRLIQIGGEAVKAIAPLFKAANAPRTLHNRAFGSLESKKILVDLGKGTLKKGLESIFVGEPPEIVFDSTNDRVVPVWSQLSNAAVCLPDRSPSDIQRSPRSSARRITRRRRSRRSSPCRCASAWTRRVSSASTTASWTTTATASPIRRAA